MIITFKRLPILFMIMTIGAFSCQIYMNHQDFLKSAPLKFDCQATNFGGILDNQVVIQKFHFKNIAPEKIKIESVKAGCGCTSVHIEKFNFDENEEGVVVVQFDPKNMHGNIKKAIVVQFLGGYKSTVLTFTADVKPVIEATPPTIEIRNSYSGNIHYNNLRVTNNSDKTVRVISVSTEVPDLNVVLPRERSLLPHKYISVHFNLQNPRVGDHSGFVHIVSAMPSQYITDIPISGSISNKWIPNDTEFYFGFLHKNDIKSQSINIDALPTSDILNAWCDAGSAATIDIKPGKDGRGSNVSLMLNGKYLAKGEFESSVFIKTKSVSEPVIRIPVVGALELQYDCHCHS